MVGLKEFSFPVVVLVGLVLSVTLNGDVVSGCPSTNVTLEHLLEGNPHLRAVYDELQQPHGGFLSLEGFKMLVTKLLMNTAACSPIRQDLKHRPNPEEGHNNDHHHDIHEENHGHETHDEYGHKVEHPHEHGDEDYHDEKGGNDDEERGSKMNAKMMVEPWAGNGEKDAGDGGKTSDVAEESGRHPDKESTGATDDIIGMKECDPVVDLLSNANLVEGSPPLSPEGFLHLCPSILNSLLQPPCHATQEGDEEGVGGVVTQRRSHGYDHSGHDHHHRHAKDDVTQMTRDAWLAAVISMVLIGLIALMCITVIPVLKKSKYYVVINHFLLALAIGSLAGDALIHLLPHAMTMKIQLGLSGHLVHALYGFTAFLGILLFLLMERLHNLMGHKHSHSHGSSANMDGDELIKEIGLMSAELNELPTQHMDRIGEKLSQQSHHNSFIYPDGTSPSDPPRSCFESCPPNLTPGLEDANGNSGSVVDPMVCKPKVVDHNSSSMAERECLVVNQSREKNEQISLSRTALNPIPPPPLVQNSPPKNMVRQDSKNFNMVLQEYHVGHHGHSHHGHSHVTGKKDSLRAMILLGDGMHTFMDGMAIGAAFGTSLTGGIATAIAVLCHELPHKVGDFAILFEMGMRRRQAIKMVLLLWVLSLMGLAVGVSIGSIKEVSPWIYCFTAGVFLYLALVDLLSELSINAADPCSAGTQMAIQVTGMLTGAGIMLVIAIYEHDLEHLLEGTF